MAFKFPGSSSRSAEEKRTVKCPVKISGHFFVKSVTPLVRSSFLKLKELIDVKEGDKVAREVIDYILNHVPQPDIDPYDFLTNVKKFYYDFSLPAELILNHELTHSVQLKNILTTPSEKEVSYNLVITPIARQF